MAPTPFRIEHDFLGDREVPADAYYGVQTLRGAENFPITGLPLHPALIRAMAIVKKAAALANRDTGHLEARIANAIAAAADDVIAGKLNAQFIVDPIQGGAGTSINMNANEVIANRALEILGEAKGSYKVISPNSHVNMAQSTNDAFPTGVHIAALDLGRSLVVELRKLHASFVDCAMLTCELGLMISYLPFGWPRSSRARFAITSLVFMLIDVPAPPWIGSTMNHLSSFPAMTSSAAVAIASAIFGSRWPVSRFASAAAFFTIPIARISAGWIGSPVIGKFSEPRSVWTP